MSADLVVRHNAVVVVGAAAFLGIGLWSLLSDATPQNAVITAVGALAFVTALRGRIELRDDVIHQRGLFGWKSPFPLAELTKASLRREAQWQRWALELELTRANGRMFSLEGDAL
jgi:hypothetical protein